MAHTVCARGVDQRTAPGAHRSQPPDELTPRPRCTEHGCGAGAPQPPDRTAPPMNSHPAPKNGSTAAAPEPPPYGAVR